jgi:GT2 family glycosyltransferase
LSTVKKAKYSVVIPVYNNASDLRQCLESLNAQTYDHELFEVIVVDNNSTDESAAVAESFGVRCLYEKTFQSSYAARNCGIKAAQGDFIVFLDSDCVAHSDWLRQIDARSDDATVGCFAGEILSAKPTTTTEHFSEAIGLLRQRGPLSGWHFKPYAQTANATYRQVVFQKVGMFEPTMKSGGDAVLAWRMLDQTDYRIQFVPEAIVYHHHRTSVPDLWSQFRRYGGGKVSWALAWSDYEPPAISMLETDLVAAFDQLVTKLEATGADTRETIFPILQSMTKVAHYSGYLEELLRSISHDSPRDAWPRFAIERATVCNICGGRAFVPGPGKRMVETRAPQCLQCGSMERHRVLYKALSTMSRQELAGWTCQSVGEPLPKHLEWFDKTSHINIAGGGMQEFSGLCDLVVAMNVLSRSGHEAFADTIETLVSPLRDAGMLLLVDQASAKEADSWATDYERQVARHLPNVSVRSSWAVDQVTGVKHMVTVASPDASRTSEIALRLHGEAS